MKTTVATFEANGYVVVSKEPKVDIDSLGAGDVVYLPFKDDSALVFEVAEIRPDHVFGLLSSYCIDKAGCQLPNALTGTNIVAEIDKATGLMVDHFAKITPLDRTDSGESFFTPPITSSMQVIKRES